MKTITIFLLTAALFAGITIKEKELSNKVDVEIREWRCPGMTAVHGILM